MDGWTPAERLDRLRAGLLEIARILGRHGAASALPATTLRSPEAVCLVEERRRA